MSDTTTQPVKQRPELILIGVFVAIGIAVLLYFSSQQQQQLRSSATGMDGLDIWLSSEGHDAQSFAGGWTISAETLGLVITPLYDSDLSEERASPQTKEELLFQQDEYDMWLWQVEERAYLAQTMVVLPKWRSGVRLTGLSHPALLVDPERTQDALHLIAGEGIGAVGHIRRPFSDFSYQTSDGDRLTARLYVAQVFEGQGCDPIIGDVGEMILGFCTVENTGDDILVLSDPDLLNNHGLRLGDNALIAQSLLPQLADGGRILIDYSQDVWITEQQEAVQHERSWSDFLRYLEYPFSVLWIGGAILMLITFWRAGLRYGPIVDAVSKLSARKGQAISARAKLMRMTGQDGALLDDYVTARMSAVSSALFGPVISGTATKEQAYLKHMKRLNPALTEKLTTLLNEMRNLPAHLPATAAISYVEAFELTLEQLAHDT
ncbi:hypothetical protein [Roseobacter sp. CCS2]|uniref:hypothetical protein n=1 Tax=Roseobacter sp. CCS2 TaxID=391593 RepID=UPI0000F3F09C|nr:hypothetical protein [Roseobacter sp. CCS2]EBA11117.1 hypothetical protein RCCS2_10110 [Roseobacter sp. CCS2]